MQDIASQNGMGHCSSIRSVGSRTIWRSIMRCLPVTVIASISAPWKPCWACRWRTALTAALAVAWARIALQHGGRDEKLLAQVPGQLGLAALRAEDLEEPELAFEDGAPPLEAIRSQPRGKHARLRGALQMQALDDAAVAAGEFEQLLAIPMAFRRAIGR